MKKLVVLFAVVAMAVLSSCGGKKSDNPLIGKWEFASIDMPKTEEAAAPTGDSMADSLTKAMSGMANGLGDAAKSMAEAMLKGTVYEFMDGGKCSMTVMGFPVDGTYEMSADKKSITMKGTGKDEKYEIVTNTDKELVLKSQDGSTMHFTAKQ